MKTQVCVNAKKNKKMKKSELRKLIKQMIPEQVGRTPQGGMPQGGNEIFRSEDILLIKYLRFFWRF